MALCCCHRSNLLLHVKALLLGFCLVIFFIFGCCALSVIGYRARKSSFYKNMCFRVCVLLLFLGGSASASSLVYDLSSQYNAIILGDLYVDSADTEGRQLVTGDFNTDIGFNYTVGTAVVGPQNPPNAGRDDLVVGGNYIGKGLGGVLVTEDAVFGGSITAAGGGISFNVAGANSSGAGTLTSNAGPLKISRSTGNVTSLSSGVNLSDLAAMIRQESWALSQLSSSNGIKATLSGTFALNVAVDDLGLDDVYVINLTQAEWEASSFLQRTISASSGSTVLINVAGNEVDLGGSMVLSGGITQNRVLVNYYEADTWSSSAFLHEGMVLAPHTSEVEISGGAINGAAVMGGKVTKTGSAEFHNFLYQGVVPVPEPGIVNLLLIGFIGGALRRNRRV